MFRNETTDNQPICPMCARIVPSPKSLPVGHPAAGVVVLSGLDVWACHDGCVTEYNRKIATACWN